MRARWYILGFRIILAMINCLPIHTICGVYWCWRCGCVQALPSPHVIRGRLVLIMPLSVLVLLQVARLIRISFTQKVALVW